jgi:hypothetical protein
VDDHKELLFTDLTLFNRKLADWLVFYNTARPHHSLGQRSQRRGRTPWLRSAGTQPRTAVSQTGNGARLDDHRALFFVSAILFEKLSKEVGRSAETGCE